MKNNNYILFEYFKSNKRLIIIILITSFIYGISNMFIPIFIGNGLNNITENSIINII